MKKIAILLAFCITGAAFAADEKPAQSPMPDSDSTAKLDDESIKTRLIYGPDRWAEIHGLVQAQYKFSKTWDTSLKSDGVTPKETSSKAKWKGDMFLNAARISLNGQLAKNSFFFFQTADLNTGKNAENTSSKSTGTKAGSYTQDAYVKFEAASFFQVYGGMLTVPRDRQNLQSQASLLTANGQFLARSSMDGYSNSGRDTGIMFRGLIPGKKPLMEYRVGAFKGLARENDDNGRATRNKHNKPRIAGRIQLSAGDTEDSYFYSENYLGKRSLFAWGIGADYQADQRKGKDYISYASDMQFDTPIPMDVPFVFSGQVGFIKAMNLPDTIGLTYSSYLQMYAQAGVLLANKVQPTLKYSSLSTGKQRFLTGGLNYYINGHYSNIKFDFDLPVGSNKNKADQYKATLQFQGYL